MAVVGSLTLRPNLFSVGVAGVVPADEIQAFFGRSGVGDFEAIQLGGVGAGIKPQYDALVCHFIGMRLPIQIQGRNLNSGGIQENGIYAQAFGFESMGYFSHHFFVFRLERQFSQQVGEIHTMFAGRSTGVGSGKMKGMLGLSGQGGTQAKCSKYHSHGSNVAKFEFSWG